MTRMFLSTAEYKAVDKDPWLETYVQYRTVFNLSCVICSRIPLLFTNTPAYYSHVWCVYHTAKKGINARLITSMPLSTSQKHSIANIPAARHMLHKTTLGVLG